MSPKFSLIRQILQEQIPKPTNMTTISFFPKLSQSSTWRRLRIPQTVGSLPRPFFF